MLTLILPKNPVINPEEVTEGLVCGKIFSRSQEFMMAIPCLLVVTDPNLFNKNLEKAAAIALLSRHAEINDSVLEGLGIRKIGLRDATGQQEQDAWREAVQGYNRLENAALQNQGCERDR